MYGKSNKVFAIPKLKVYKTRMVLSYFTHIARSRPQAEERMRGLQVAGWKASGREVVFASSKMAGSSGESGKKIAGCKARPSPVYVG